MTHPDLARLEGLSTRTLEQALEQNFRDGTLAGAVEIIAGTIADAVEGSTLEEAAIRLGQVPALLARIQELEDESSWLWDALEKSGRFWSGVAVGEPDECWPWLRARTARGYGTFKCKAMGVTSAAHAALLFSGSRRTLDKPWALHSCDNPPCCNPNHLRWGTPLENVGDMGARGRHHRWNGARLGEGNPVSKLTDDLVLGMLRDTRCQRLIAADYGVSETAVQKVKAGTAWKHIFAKWKNDDAG